MTTKISVFIPTIPDHFTYLDKILPIYIDKSVEKPDEIVVSVSQCDDIPNLKFITNKYKDVKFLLHKDALLSGPNRQFSNQCKGDIIVYHNSNALPHIQRLQIIKHFFNKYDIVHLNHSYDTKKNYNENIIDIKKDITVIRTGPLYRKYYPHKNLKECIKYNTYGGDFENVIDYVHSGITCIRKEVLNHIKWKHPNELNFVKNELTFGDDYEFNMETLFKYNKSMIIDSKIYFKK